jgi:hypothetical protein
LGVCPRLGGFQSRLRGEFPQCPRREVARGVLPRCRRLGDLQCPRWDDHPHPGEKAVVPDDFRHWADWPREAARPRRCSARRRRTDVAPVRTGHDRYWKATAKDGKHRFHRKGARDCSPRRSRAGKGCCRRHQTAGIHCRRPKDARHCHRRAATRRQRDGKHCLHRASRPRRHGPHRHHRGHRRAHRPSRFRGPRPARSPRLARM